MSIITIAESFGGSVRHYFIVYNGDNEGPSCTSTT
jgi:hypothetical protein